jgi:hypothetical protein
VGTTAVGSFTLVLSTVNKLGSDPEIGEVYRPYGSLDATLVPISAPTTGNVTLHANFRAHPPGGALNGGRGQPRPDRARNAGLGTVRSQHGSAPGGEPLSRDRPPTRASPLVVAVALSVAGCSSSSGPSTPNPPGTPQDEITAVPFPTTVQLATADLASLQPDPGDGTLTFTTPPAPLAAVDVGSILVAGVSPATPSGLLRAVLAVDRSGGQLVLRTGQAPIQLAYKKLHVKFNRSAAVASGNSARLPLTGRSPALGTGFDKTLPFSYVLFDGDGDPGTTNDQLVTDGTIGGGFDFSLSVDVDWGGIDALPDVVKNCLKSFANVLTGKPPSCSIDDLLPEARTTFVVDPQIHGDANVHGVAFYKYEKEVDLTSATLPPIPIGPLVFVPTIDITAVLSGGASGTFKTGIHGSAVFESSVTLSTKSSSAPQLSDPTLKSTDFGLNDTQITLHAEAKIAAGARLNILLFGVTGPYATALAYGRVQADLLSSPCWGLYAGVEMNLGVKVTTPTLPFIGAVTLADWHSPDLNPFEVSIATGACAPPPNPPTLPPGSGPDSSHFAQPTFAPWSRTYAAPVEGALAGSPGNSTTYSDLLHAIDGNYLRSGWGVRQLVKLDESGKVVWARELQLDGQTLRPARVRPTADGALMVASTSLNTLVLTRLGQDGTVQDARAFDVPLDTCTLSLTALAQDGADGHLVTGGCVGSGKTFLVRVPGVGSPTLTLVDPGAGGSTNPRVVESIGQEVFVAGVLSDPLDSMFAMRLTLAGGIVWSKSYQACASAPDTIPSAAIVGQQEAVTIAGSGGAQHNGMVVRLLADGTVGFASFPGFGFGAGSVFLFDSFAELPTTGYVAGGSTVQLTAQSPAGVPSAALVGLDATGAVLWAKRYTFGPAAAFVASGLVGVRLTDDGGILATALVADPAHPLDGFLWAFKPFARDGSIAFSSDAVTVTDLPITNLTCSLTASDRTFTTQVTSIVPRTPAVASVPVQVVIAQQTPQ